MIFNRRECNNCLICIICKRWCVRLRLGGEENFLCAPQVTGPGPRSFDSVGVCRTASTGLIIGKRNSKQKQKHFDLACPVVLQGGALVCTAVVTEPTIRSKLNFPVTCILYAYTNLRVQYYKPQCYSHSQDG